MSKYSGLRIASISGKGAEGCGVQKVSKELQVWGQKNDVTVDYYAYDKKFQRAEGHNMEILYFNINNIKELAQKINNEYDIVMFMSYPSTKHDHDYSKSFYYDFYEAIQKPLKVFIELDIHKGQIDKTPYLIPMIHNADTVMHYNIDTWFSTAIDELGIQKVNERLFKYTLWLNFDELDIIRNKYINQKKKGMVSVTRWSSLKNVRRSIDIIDSLQKLQPDWDCNIFGIERSIGAKFDIIDYEKTKYINTKGIATNEETGTVCVHGPIIQAEGINEVGSHTFASAFFSLPKNPENYGDRMEYTQIEIPASGTIPIFDLHWAKNNKTKSGKTYYEIPYSAIYTDGTDIDFVAKKMVDIANNPIEMQKYLDTSYNLVKQEFDANTVVPETIELIKRVGKNKNQKTVYEIYEKFANIEYANGIKKLEEEGKIPILGIGELETPTLEYLEGSKQVLVKKIKLQKGGKTKLLF